MRNHDLVSDGFLALTTASLVLLCSSLLAFAFVQGELPLICRRRHGRLTYALRSVILTRTSQSREAASRAGLPTKHWDQPAKPF